MNEPGELQTPKFRDNFRRARGAEARRDPARSLDRGRRQAGRIERRSLKAPTHFFVARLGFGSIRHQRADSGRARPGEVARREKPRSPKHGQISPVFR